VFLHIHPRLAPCGSVNHQTARLDGVELGTVELQQHVVHNGPFNVRQTSFQAIVVKRQPFMVKAEQVQDRRVEVVDRDNVVDGFVAEVIGRTEAEGSFDSGTRKPAGETFRIVIPSAGTFLEGRHAAEFGTPHDERVFQETALLQIGDQSGSRLIKNRTVEAVLLLDRFVAIPVADSFSARLIRPVKQLNEANALFEQPTSEDAVLREGSLEKIL